MDHDASSILSGWQVVVIYVATLLCSTICVLVPFFLITKTQQLLDAVTRGSPIYLRGVTVILIVWAATALSVQGRLTEGPAAIFGMVAGYVFGAMNHPPPPPRPSSGMTS